ncbi:hypothetical protein IAT38_004088 [Cryptococcus sp. DSM 104549]
MSPSSKIVLITGANRGIGLGITKIYLSKGWTVVAAVRDPSAFPKLDGTVIPVKVDSLSLTDAKEAVEELKTKHGITHLDVVIANAGISENFNDVKALDIDVLDKHHFVNVRGPVVLYQAVYPLLGEGSTFTVISSYLGSNSVEHFPALAAYGASKTAINYIVRNIHFEEPKFTAFTIHPGHVDTDMGKEGAKFFGIANAPQTVEEISPQVVDLIESATRDTHGGYMWHYDGEKGAW